MEVPITRHGRIVNGPHTSSTIPSHEPRGRNNSNWSRRRDITVLECLPQEGHQQDQERKPSRLRPPNTIDVAKPRLRHPMIVVEIAPAHLSTPRQPCTPAIVLLGTHYPHPTRIDTVSSIAHRHAPTDTFHNITIHATPPSSLPAHPSNIFIVYYSSLLPPGSA